MTENHNPEQQPQAPYRTPAQPAYAPQDDPYGIRSSYVTPEPVPARKPRARKIIIPAAFLIGGMFIGGAAGAAKPAVEVTKEVPGPTITKTVPTASAACLEALNYADEGFGYAADGFGAISDGDLAALRQATQNSKDLAPLYNAAKQTCRNAS